MIRCAAIAFLAYASALHGQEPQAPAPPLPETAPAEEPSPRAAYAAAVRAARDAREASTRTAETNYNRVAEALEAASSALTADARQRLESSGPIADARDKRAAALQSARAAYQSDLEAAARSYGPAAQALHSAVEETIDSLRTDLQIYEAVMGAAQDALEARQRTASGSAREQQSSESDYRQASGTLEQAKRTLEAARGARERIRKREPDYDSYKPSTAETVLSGLTAGLAEYVGDQATSRQIQDEAAADLNQSFSSYEAARSAWEAALAQASSAVEAAEDEWDAASRRSAQARGRYDSAAGSQDAASREQAVAAKARKAAMIDAASVARVLDSAELGAVADVLRTNAISLVAALEEHVLTGITRERAVNTLQAALDAYAGRRIAAIEAGLAAIDAGPEQAVAAARERAQAAHRAKIRAHSDKVERDVQALGRTYAASQTEYERALEVADSSLLSALTTFRALKPKQQTRPRQRAGLQASLSAHTAAVHRARSKRVGAVAQRVPSAAGLLDAVAAELKDATPPVALEDLLGNAAALPGDAGAPLQEHKEQRRHADIVFGAAVKGEYRARLGAVIPDYDGRVVAAAEQEASQTAEAEREAFPARIPYLVDRSEALRALDADVRAGIVRAAGNAGAPNTREE